jgi:hypothetical protein
MDLRSTLRQRPGYRLLAKAEDSALLINAVLKEPYQPVSLRRKSTWKGS